MKNRDKSVSPLEAALLQCLTALDNQVAREMQRTPAERELHGVQKWAPYSKRVELIAGLLAEQLGNNTIELDGMIVLAQALSKALSLFVDEMGAEGLGRVRSEYVAHAGDAMAADARRLSAIVPQQVLM
jgi:hypothetical protein